MIEKGIKQCFISRKEIIHKEEEARRTWTAKFNPWLIDEYRQVRSIAFSFYSSSLTNNK